MFIFPFLYPFSDPPLEEDDIPRGEWVCHRCKVAPIKEVN